MGATTSSGDLSCLLVGLEQIGETNFAVQQNFFYEGMRGADRQLKRARRHALCIRFGKNDETAINCPSWVAEGVANIFYENGNTK